MTRLETLAYHIRSHVMDLCESKCGQDNSEGRKELGKSWGRDVEPCVRSGKACETCIGKAEGRVE